MNEVSHDPLVRAMTETTPPCGCQLQYASVYHLCVSVIAVDVARCMYSVVVLLCVIFDLTDTLLGKNVLCSTSKVCRLVCDDNLPPKNLAAELLYLRGQHKPVSRENDLTTFVGWTLG